MWEAVVAALSVFISVVLTALAMAWRYRKVIGVVVDWLLEAYRDGRITREELAILFKRLGRSLEEVE